MPQDYSRVDPDSMAEAVQEALVFVHLHGWTLRKAVALTGACPKLVAKTKRRTGRLECFLPTPLMIKQQCEEFRLTNPRHLHSDGRLGNKECSIREYSANGSSTGFTFDAT